MTFLPNKILLHVLAYLAPCDHLNFALTSHRFHIVFGECLLAHRALYAQYRDKVSVTGDGLQLSPTLKIFVFFAHWYFRWATMVIDSRVMPVDTLSALESETLLAEGMLKEDRPCSKDSQS